MPLHDLNMTAEQLRHLDGHIAETVAQAVERASRRPWWQLNLSQLVTVSVVIFGAVVSLGWYQHDLEMLKTWRVEMTTKVNEIDGKGTAAGRSDISVMKQVISQHETRLLKVEDVREKLGVIEEKINNLQQMLKEEKAKREKP